MEHDVAAGYACVVVSDTGTGMEPEIRERIFDPFFTTKEVGDGTGMGLSVVHGIVESCSGMIDVETEVGKGTVFTVYFPLLEQLERVLPSQDEDEENLVGSEYILVVDDERSILEVSKNALEYYGYSVQVAENSREGWQMFHDSPDLFQVVITDQTMPHLTGVELAAKINTLRPATPIILCSGYSELPIEGELASSGIQKFLAKPLTGKNLAESVREVLDAA